MDHLVVARRVLKAGFQSSTSVPIQADAAVGKDIHAVEILELNTWFVFNSLPCMYGSAV